MAKTNLTKEEKAKIIEALNSDTEPSPELMEKLFDDFKSDLETIRGRRWDENYKNRNTLAL